MQRILVVIDPSSEQQPALERATWYAKRAGATLELFICDYDQSLAADPFVDPASAEKARETLIQDRMSRLKRHARELARQGVEASVDARWDFPLHDGIVRKAAESGVDLVMKDTHYHTALRRSVFSNTDWSLIRASRRPLWLVKPRAIAERPRVVAAVDPLHARDAEARLDDEILAAAKAIQAAVHAELHVFHAFDIAAALAASGDSMVSPMSLPIAEIAEMLEARHRDAVAALAGRHSIDPQNVHVCQGATRERLLALTDEMNADLVVMGAVSRSGLRRLFLGSTAEQVLDHLHCDVLVINAGGVGLSRSTRRDGSRRATAPAKPEARSAGKHRRVRAESRPPHAARSE
ncbi:MAG TPA: universal stress protein [Gammaproteobacteria bacterium]|nr:universal stress protein [Gammaproteobacteria bacterium]